LKTAKGFVMRPIQRLHLLDDKEDEEKTTGEDGRGEERRMQEESEIDDKRPSSMLINPGVDQGAQDIPTQDRIPTTTTRYGRPSFQPSRL